MISEAPLSSPQAPAKIFIQLHSKLGGLETLETQTAREALDWLQRKLPEGPTSRLKNPKDSPSLWVDLQDLDPPSFEVIGQYFAFHPLSLRTTLKGKDENPVLQLFDDHAYMLLHRIFYRFEDESVDYRPVSAFFSSQLLVTFHSSNLSRLFHGLRQRAEGAPNQHYQFGVGTILLGVIEGLIADYQPILENWQEELDQLEEQVLHARAHPSEKKKEPIPSAAPTQGTGSDMIPKILKFKKLAGNLRKSLHPQRQVLAQLNDHARNPWLDEHERPWVKHVLEDWNSLLREIDHLRTHVAGVFEVYATALTLEMTRSANQQNRVMQRLNVITAIFLPLTFIVGVYGMNIPDIPEIKMPGFYSLLWGFMLGLSVSLVALFKWMRWF